MVLTALVSYRTSFWAPLITGAVRGMMMDQYRNTLILTNLLKHNNTHLALGAEFKRRKLLISTSGV